MGNLTDVAERILGRAKKLDAHAEASGLPSTHFFYDTLGDLPGDLEKERRALVDETQDLKRLALGPVGMLLETLFTVGGLQTIQTPRARAYVTTFSLPICRLSASCTTTRSPNTCPRMETSPLLTSPKQQMWIQFCCAASYSTP
jgi:hypothetical protein